MIELSRYDAIIIGAGPAGLFAAIELGYQNKKVLLLEKNDKAGKKLLLSGAGQCNVTQAGLMDDYANHYGNQYKYIKKALQNFTNSDTINFFEERGLVMEVLENGKVFPKSRSASDVLKLLLKECDKYGVEIRYNKEVIRIMKDEGFYRVETDYLNYRADFVIIATGGMSYPQTGSTGDGYEFAVSLGQKIVEPSPALTPVEIKDFPFKSLAGISIENLPFAIWRNGKKIKDCEGDVLFTHKGLSGPGILNNSRWMDKNDQLFLNFIKEVDIQAFHKKLLDEIDVHGKDMIKTVLRKQNLPKKLLEVLLAHIQISEEARCAQINKQTRNTIVNSLTNFPLEISRMGGYHLAMVTAGGVDMKQINPTTMESRLNKSLYFIGEVLDIDGDTGGYNIQAAFSMAKLCAKGICKALNKEKKTSTKKS